MGEIKSTLDIVMERTKHLSMSQEEKDAQKQDNAKKTIKGLIQKVQDNMISYEKLDEQLTSLEKSMGFDIKRLVMADITGRLTLGRDNTFLIELLRNLYAVSTSGFNAVFIDYENAVTDSYRNYIAIARDDLLKKYGISGAAVMPNLGNNEKWKKEIEDIHARYSEKLEEVKAGL